MDEKIAITVSLFGECDPSVLEPLRKDGFKVVTNTFGRKLNRVETLKLCNGCIGVVAGTETYDKDMIERLPGVKIISRCGIGMDSIDLGAAEKAKIKVFNTPDAPTLAVAELSIGLILALLRKIPLMDRKMRTNKWEEEIGGLLCGKKVGIVGFGRIGKRVAWLLKALGADVCYFDPFVDEEAGSVFAKVEFKKLLKESDIVTLHLPYSKQSHNLIGENELSLMKQTALLINCARGGIVHEGALYSALKKNRLAGAALDVFELEPYMGPLKELDNIILTPHVGSFAKETRINMERQAVKNLINGFKNI